MRLLILGATGPYPERISAFTEAGHQVWYFCTEVVPTAAQVGHIPVLTAADLGARQVEEAAEALIAFIERERIEAIYSLLNVWDGSNQVTAELLRRRAKLPVPLIRHYKEHYLTPSEDERICLEQSDGVIFINELSRDYFARVYQLPARTACFDADLIPRRYLTNSWQPKLSAQDNCPHFLIAGTVTDDNGRYDYRELINELTARRAHVHLYGQFRRLHSNGQMRNTPDVQAIYEALNPRNSGGAYLHLHAPVMPERFVAEWSRYDAGLLHATRADDAFRRLNMPNRYSAYLAAGLPIALPDNEATAMQHHLEKLGAAIVYRSFDELVARLPDEAATRAALAAREHATFEAIFPRLIEFIRSCLH